ncbi:MAG: hypothetical protein ABSB84_09360 [Verrucomicrobiota bacterium]|jgi:hypothetical protein
MAAKIKTWLAIGVKFGAPLFSILGACGFFVCNSYPYRIDYIQEANLDRFTIFTLASLLAGIFLGAIALRLSSQKRFLNGGLWLGVSLIGLAALFFDPRLMVKSVLTAQNICINNQREIEGAKAEWAQRTGATNGTEIDCKDIAPYFTNGFPKCPEGGTYNLGKVGEPVLCSITNHLLPPQYR